jgi:hypothetical protein
VNLRQPITVAPTGIVAVVLVFLVGGPFVLAAVFAVMTLFSSTPIPQAAPMIPLMWWASVLVAPEHLRITLIPTFIAAVLMWSALRVMLAQFPGLIASPGRMVAACAVIGGLTSLVSWEIVSLLFDGVLLSDLAWYIVRTFVMPTGIVLGTFVGCFCVGTGKQTAV